MCLFLKLEYIETYCFDQLIPINERKERLKAVTCQWSIYAKVPTWY